MIGKAKIFLCALFSPNKHVPPARFSVKWYHKCLLVLVRQYKTFKECPKEIRHFEWERAKAKYSVYWGRGETGFCILAAIVGGLYLRNKEMFRTEKLVEYRKEEGLPEIPKYELKVSFGKTDNFYHTYNTPFPKDYRYP